jgi:hypothetical protein
MKQLNAMRRNPQKGKTPRIITRRRFIRNLSAGAAGAALATALPGLGRAQTGRAKDLSKVVIARHPNSVIDAYTFDQSIVGELVNWAITEFTGQEAPGLAWAQVFPGINASSVVSIKVNCINSACSSHPEVAYAVAEGLASMRLGGGSFSRNNIIIWDRWKTNLNNAGYMIYEGSDTNAIRCFGTGLGPGYDPDDYDWDSQFAVQGKTVAPSPILTQESDYLINLPVLKNHTGAGITLGMKNHLGSVYDPEDLHHIDPELAELNQIFRDHLDDKDKITIVDALVGINTTGPGGAPQFAYQGIILGTDLVAVDCVGRDVLADNGWLGSPDPSYLAAAADPPYNLGTNDPAEIEVVEQNPIPSATREHVDKMIRFHQQGLATALQVQWAINRYARGL